MPGLRLSVWLCVCLDLRTCSKVPDIFQKGRIEPERLPAWNTKERRENTVVNVSVVECADMRSDDCCHPSVCLSAFLTPRCDRTGVPYVRMPMQMQMQAAAARFFNPVKKRPGGCGKGGERKRQAGPDRSLKCRSLARGSLALPFPGSPGREPCTPGLCVSASVLCPSF